MGLAASQARLLLLTARKSDLELRAQQITNTEMVLAMQTEQIAKKYSNKLSNKELRLQTSSNLLDGEKSADVAVSYTNLIANNYMPKYAKGGAVDPKISDAELQNLIKRGVVVLYNVTYDDNNNAVVGDDAVNVTGSTDFFDTYYTEDDGAATAEYDSKMAEIQVKEKQLQLDLQQVENQQKACDTEIDSVKKIIEKNIDRTFKVFA